MLIHAGFAKTATTTLQRDLFARHSQINYLGLPAEEPTVGDLIGRITKADSTQFSIAAARSVAARYTELANGKRLSVLSYENFSLYESTDKGVVAQRLYDTFGKARILFTIRRQEDLLASWYLQKLPKYIRGHNYVDFQTWFDMKRREPHKSILHDLNFVEVISYYENLHGRESIKVLLFEQLRKDPNGFIGDLCTFMNTDTEEAINLMKLAHRNPTLSNRRLLVGRACTELIPRVLNRLGHRATPYRIKSRILRFLDGGPRASIGLPPAAHQWVRDNCAQGNSLLNERYALGLEEYGYCLLR